MPGILFEKCPPVGLITLNRPEHGNALDLDACGLLADAWLDFRDDPDLWVAIVTGAGDTFCTGGEPSDLLHLLDTDAATAAGAATTAAVDRSLVALLRDVAIDKPIIAAVNGDCRAAGWELLHAADVRLAADTARFDLGGPRHGFFPVAGAATLLPRQLGLARALALLLIDEPISARRACDYGLLTEVVAADQLLPAAWRYAELICRNSPLAVRAVKAAVRGGLALPLAEALAREQEHAARAFASEDALEAIAAHQQQRPPRWRGR